MRGYDPEEESDVRYREAIEALGAGEFERAFALVRTLAAEGRALAIHFLGWLHHKGLGTPQDDVAAVRCWRIAARGGIAGAMQGLGWAYEHGRGVAADPVQAYAWYQRALAHGDEAAREFLFELASRLSPEQVRAAEALAREATLPGVEPGEA